MGNRGGAKGVMKGDVNSYVLDTMPIVGVLFSYITHIGQWVTLKTFFDK